MRICNNVNQPGPPWSNGNSNSRGGSGDCKHDGVIVNPKPQQAAKMLEAREQVCDEAAS